MSKLIYGVAYNSKDKYKTTKNGRPTLAYSTWRNMIERCYSPSFHEKNPSYIDCLVDKQWHDFQDFAEWFYSHPYSSKGFQLDKDLLSPCNKVYSPDTCCFVPQSLNKILTDSRSNRGYLPQGVSFYKLTSSYVASINIDNNKKTIGYFCNPEEAHQAYKVAKEAYVKEKALEWEDRIAPNVFQALMSWTLDGSSYE